MKLIDVTKPFPRARSAWPTLKPRAGPMACTAHIPRISRGSPASPMLRTSVLAMGNCSFVPLPVTSVKDPVNDIGKNRLMMNRGVDGSSHPPEGVPWWGKWRVHSLVPNFDCRTDAASLYPGKRVEGRRNYLRVVIRYAPKCGVKNGPSWPAVWRKGPSQAETGRLNDPVTSVISMFQRLLSV